MYSCTYMHLVLWYVQCGKSGEEAFLSSPWLLFKCRCQQYSTCFLFCALINNTTCMYHVVGGGGYRHNGVLASALHNNLLHTHMFSSPTLYNGHHPLRTMNIQHCCIIIIVSKIIITIFKIYSVERSGMQIRHLGKKVWTITHGNTTYMYNTYAFAKTSHQIYTTWSSSEGGLCDWLIISCQRSLELYFKSYPPQSSKRDDKRNGDLIPVMPFFMTPTRISYYMRERLGVTRILKAARSPTSIIDLKDIARPIGQLSLYYLHTRQKMLNRLSCDWSIARGQGEVASFPPTYLRPVVVGIVLSCLFVYSECAHLDELYTKLMCAVSWFALAWSFFWWSSCRGGWKGVEITCKKPN